MLSNDDNLKNRVSNGNTQGNFCWNCGRSLSGKFENCPYCGEKINSPEPEPVQNQTSQEDKQRKRFKWWIIPIVVAAIAAIVIIIVCSNSKSNSSINYADGTTISDENQYVLYVKNSTSESYPEITFGEAFDYYFANPTWKYFKSKDGEDVVEFTGSCLYNDESVDLKIQFLLDLDHDIVTIYFVSMNDITQDNSFLDTLKESVFSTYEEAQSVSTEEDAFTDISDCAADTKTAIKWVSDRGIVTGLNDGTFAPYVFCTRQQIVIMLWRLSDKPEPQSIDSALKFTDTQVLSEGAKKAIAWAVEQGIVSGYEDGSFNPNEYVTRLQTVVMLWRLAGEPEAETTSAFTDTANCSEDEMKAINWAASVGITKGSENSDGTYSFLPDDFCQRQHIALFVYRYSSVVKYIIYKY